MTDHRWFVAVLVYQSRVGGWDDEPIVDHQIRLISAPTADAAYDRAVQLGDSHEHHYLNRAGERISRDFLGLSELDELGEAAPKHGDEVFSWRTTGPGREFVKQKDDLSAFANTRNAKKTARELLGE